MYSSTARSSLPVPPDEDLGPAMLACTTLERAFVIAFLETGGSNQGRAAMIAGSSSTQGAAGVWASRALRKPRVLDAIREVTDMGFKSDVFMARAAMREMVLDKNHASHFKAVDATLNRAGMIVAAISRVEHEHKITLDTGEIRAAIANDLKMLGLPVPKEVLEGEFTEVEDNLADILA